jgi:hypothetical protein
MKVMMRAKRLELYAARRPRDWGSPEEEEEGLRTLKGDKSKRLSSEAIRALPCGRLEGLMHSWRASLEGKKIL